MELHYQPYGRGMTTDPLISRRTLMGPNQCVSCIWTFRAVRQRKVLRQPIPVLLQHHLGGHDSCVYVIDEETPSVLDPICDEREDIRRQLHDHVRRRVVSLYMDPSSHSWKR